MTTKYQRSPIPSHFKLTCRTAPTLAPSRQVLCLAVGWLATATGWTQPMITTQPQDQTVKVGSPAFFTVAATGAPPLTYQWRKDGADIPGATGATCALGLARTNQAGSYTVVVSNSAGSVTSAPPTVLTVNAVPPGAVFAWRRDNFDNSFVTEDVPVEGLSGVTAIAAGTDFTGRGFALALKTDGSLLPSIYNPAQSGVRAVAASGYHIVALKDDGAVLELGPFQIDVPADLNGVTAIAAGRAHTVALKIDGSVVAWGDNGYGQTNVPVEAQTGVIAVAAGEAHTVALKSNGSVLAWGDNWYGQTSVPPEIPGEVIAIAAGVDFTAVLKNNGSVVTWERNWDAGGVTRFTLAQGGVTAIAAGAYDTVALKEDGSVHVLRMCCGELDASLDAPSRATAIAGANDYAVAILVPTTITMLTPPVSQTVNVGQRVSLSVAATGYPLLYQWRKDGKDIGGVTASSTYSFFVTQTNQAGHYDVVVGNSTASVTSTPPAVLTVIPGSPGLVMAWGENLAGATDVPLAVRSGVTAIAAGFYYTLALKNDGSVVAWNNNLSGQTAVPPAAQSGVIAVAAGYLHAVVLKDDGTVVAWGDNFNGQTDVPAGLSGVTAIAAGSYHTVALEDDGSVVAWGWNHDGQTTVPPEAQSGVTAIAAGYGHSVALKNDGTVVEWGLNDRGQTDVPLDATLGDVIAIAAGAYHTVALKSDGTVIAWGYNALGQVTGTPAIVFPNSDVANPVTLGGEILNGVTAIAAGSSQTVALKQDGSVVAWGSYGLTTVPDGLSGVTAIAAGVDYTMALLGIAPVIPTLHTHPNGDALIFSWPTNAVGFTLQSTPSLSPPVTWTDSAVVPAAVGARFTVTNAITGDARFYRLRKP